MPEPMTDERLGSCRLWFEGCATNGSFSKYGEKAIKDCFDEIDRLKEENAELRGCCG